MDIKNFLRAVLEQDKEALREYFSPDAYVNWHCTNEHFTVDEYINANCSYPGAWDGEIERIEFSEDSIIIATHVFSKDKSTSFHVVSFIRLENERIRSMDEYWADDGDAPLWRKKLKIGKPIR